MSTGDESDRSISLTVSDPGEARSLRLHLERMPGVRLEIADSRPGPGELGALDVVSIVGGSSALLSAIKVIPEFIRSRRSHVTVTVTSENRSVKVTATNLPDAVAAVEQWLASSAAAEEGDQDGAS